MLITSLSVLSGQADTQDDCARRHAPLTAAEEPDGDDDADEVKLLRLEPSHHSGRG